MKKYIAFLLLMMFLALASPLSALAEETFHPQGTMLRKLERGFANTLLGGLESVYHLRQSRGDKLLIPWVGAIGQSFYYILRRTFVGLYEVVTFPIPCPGDYRPIIQPEFVWGYPPRKKVGR